MITFMWGVNVALLAAATLWVCCIGSSLHSMEVLTGEVRAITTAFAAGFQGDQTLAVTRSFPTLGVILAVASSLAMCASLFLRPSRFRTVRGWLLFTSIVAGWLFFCVAWQDIYWQGQQLRLSSSVFTIEEFSERLTENWPAEDGEFLDTMAFLAYPRSVPTTLLVLGTAHFPKSNLFFSAVERSAGGVIRYELAGNESGAWVEIRPDGSQPKSFVGGLDTHYRMTQAARLSPRLFLVRYQE